jgi:hypothetical protein
MAEHRAYQAEIIDEVERQVASEARAMAGHIAAAARQSFVREVCADEMARRHDPP